MTPKNRLSVDQIFAFSSLIGILYTKTHLGILCMAFFLVFEFHQKTLFSSDFFVHIYAGATAVQIGRHPLILAVCKKSLRWRYLHIFFKINNCPALREYFVP